jgi:phage terminase large subunit
MTVRRVREISTGYTPRVFQKSLHKSLRRFNVLVCHRRFGKTVFTINECLDRALRNDLKNPQYAYIAPTYGQAKRVAWDYFKEYTRNIPGVTVNEAELRIDIPRPDRGDRIRFMLLGAENPNSLRGLYLDGVILDEFAEMDPTAWSQVVRPALSDRIGWAIFIGTPKGQNHFFDIYEKCVSEDDWFRAIYKASDTGVVAPSELRAARMTMSEEEYEQEYECSFTAAMVGAYYAKILERLGHEGRIGKVSWEPHIPVCTYWDLGISDTLCIWFGQVIGREIRWIDYLEDSGKGLDFYAKELKDKPYVYGFHFLPHDGAARELGTGKTRQETLEDLMGRRNIEICPLHRPEDGINAVRVVLDRSFFDLEKCGVGLKALKNYQRKWDSKNGMFMSRPLHNWASHASDAFRTAAMSINDSHGIMERVPNNSKIANLPRMSVTDYDIFE